MKNLVISIFILALLKLENQFILGDNENVIEDQGFCTLEHKDDCLSKPGKKETEQSDKDCFRAAVVEYQRIDYYEDIVKTAKTNLEIFSQIAKQARDHQVKMIVFPEDGLFLGTKKTVVAMLSEIPDPQTLNEYNNNPCDHSDKFSQSSVLIKLSCIAKENNLYLVANFGTRQNCKPLEMVGNRICPEIGFLALNTDVVLDPKGVFIRRYRKYNMFIEIFDKAPSLETVYFDTPYGRFGIFTCFDLLFKKPALQLVEEHHIDTAIFPTWWYDELPLLTAIQTQDSWSAMTKVNMLGSNIHKKALGSVGSGIFTANDQVYVTANDSHSKLIIANIARKGSSNKCDFDPVIVDLEAKLPAQDYVYKQYELTDSDQIHILDKNEDTHHLCNKEVCCTIDYKIRKNLSDNQTKSLNKVVLIVRNGLRPGVLNWYEQVCAIATLKNSLNRAHLNETTYSTSGLQSFERLSLKSNFQSNYILPIAAYNVSYLMRHEERSFNCDFDNKSNMHSCKLEYLAESTSSERGPIYSFGMYSRLFGSDKMPEGW